MSIDRTINLDQPVSAVLGDLFALPGIGTRTQHAIRNDGINTVRELISKTRFEMLRIPNFGKVALAAVRAELDKSGLSLSGEQPSMPPSPRARNWYAMFTAPRNGTRIIAILNDFSGVLMVRWGATVDEPKRDAWFHTDWHDEVGGDADFAGWIPVPQGTPEHAHRDAA